MLRRKKIFNLLLVLLGLFLAFLTAEVIVYWFNLAPFPVFPKGQYITHDTLGHRFSENYEGCMVSEDRIKTCIKTNKYGIWDEKEEYSEPIIVIGDSYTFGAWCCSLNRTYPKLAQKYLGKEIVNLGVPGYETKNYLESIKHYSRILSPKLIIVTFYIGNDVKGNPYKYTEKKEYL